MANLIRNIWQVLSSVVTVGVVLGGLFWLLRKKLEEYFARRIEQAKHELELKADKLSIVYEHQRMAFAKCLHPCSRVLPQSKTE